MRGFGKRIGANGCRVARQPQGDFVECTAGAKFGGCLWAKRGDLPGNPFHDHGACNLVPKAVCELVESIAEGVINHVASCSEGFHPKGFIKGARLCLGIVDQAVSGGAFSVCEVIKEIGFRCVWHGRRS